MRIIKEPTRSVKAVFEARIMAPKAVVRTAVLLVGWLGGWEVQWGMGMLTG